MIYIDPMMSGERGRMVKAFSAVIAPVRFFHRQDELFREGIVGERLTDGDGGVLLWLRRWGRLRLWLQLLRRGERLLLLQVNPLVSREGGGVVELFATVAAGVRLPVRVDSLVP